MLAPPRLLDVGQAHDRLDRFLALKLDATLGPFVRVVFCLVRSEAPLFLLASGSCGAALADPSEQSVDGVLALEVLARPPALRRGRSSALTVVDLVSGGGRLPLLHRRARRRLRFFFLPVVVGGACELVLSLVCVRGGLALLLAFALARLAVVLRGFLDGCR